MLRFYEFYSDDLFYYVVTEYCDGGDLFALMTKRGGITMAQTCKIIKQVLAAVEYCHKRRIVHRDLKPDNIVFEYEDLESTLKVIDFGSSKLLKPRERLTEQTGSVRCSVTVVLLHCAGNSAAEGLQREVRRMELRSDFVPDAVRKAAVLQHERKGSAGADSRGQGEVRG